MKTASHYAQTVTCAWSDVRKASTVRTVRQLHQFIPARMAMFQLQKKMKKKVNYQYIIEQNRHH